VVISQNGTQSGAESEVFAVEGDIGFEIADPYDLGFRECIVNERLIDTVRSPLTSPSSRHDPRVAWSRYKEWPRWRRSAIPTGKCP
jgi:hypothetical protein